MQTCAVKKYPKQLLWDNETYYDIAFQWIGKEKELLKKVLKLEKELNIKS